mgnify:CR=1 FL=1
MKTITFVYSSESVEALKKLFTELRWVFGYTTVSELNDMFYYGVFCKPITYSNFKGWEKAQREGIEVPEILTAICPTPSEREDFVKRIINEIIKGEIEKPEWMKYVEEETTCSCCDAAPSTFLSLIPKEEKYQALADKLLEFLYSPNMMITELK